MTINGTIVENDLDVFVAAGGCLIALDRTYSVTVTGGSISILFTSLADPAFINAIEITDTGSGGGGSGSDYLTTYTYDTFGHLSGVSMPRPTGTQTRSFSYSVDGRLYSSTQPENGTTSYTYNSYNQIASKTDAKGQVVEFDYEQYNHRLVSVVRKVPNPGNPSQKIVDLCQSEVYSYDTNPYVTGDAYSATQFGRLKAVRYWGGAPANAAPSGYGNCGTMFTEMYAYTTGGAVAAKRLRVTRYASGTGAAVNLDLEQTADYNIYSGTGPVHMTGTQYPKSVATTSGTQYDGPSLAWTYDTAGRLATMTSTQSGTTTNVITSVGYNVAGEITSMSGAYSETRGYNALFQLTSISAPGVSMTYAYSATQNNGKIVSQTDAISGETVQYTYDSLNRLATAVATNNSWGQSYQYDGFGNLTNQNVIAGTAPSWSQSFSAATNRISGETADANGNIGSGTTYTYDIDNRVVQVPGASTYYSYAPGNKRIYKKVGSADPEVVFYGISGQKIATYTMSFGFVNPNPNVLTLTQTGTYYYFGGKLVKNAAGYVGQDRIGSVGKFYPYGQEKPSATTSNKEKFATYYRDEESGLDYAQNRYHAPGQGRFLTPDPYQASGRPEDPASWNKYAYVEGDSINYNDSTGLFRVPVESGGEVDYCSNNLDDPACLTIVILSSGQGSSPNPGSPAISTAILTALKQGVGQLQDEGLVGYFGTSDYSTFTLSLVNPAPAAPIVATFCAANPVACAVIGGAVVITAGAAVIWNIVDALKVMPDDCPQDQRQTTPSNNPDKNWDGFDGCKVDPDTGQVYCRDKLHKDHWEVYKNRKARENGDRDRELWDSGCLRRKF